MKIKAIKDFKWCVDSNIYPSIFLENHVYDINDDDAQGAIGAGWAVSAKDTQITTEANVVVENTIDDAGWEEPEEAPFTEEAGSELSALPQGTASQETIAEKPKKSGRKAGE